METHFNSESNGNNSGGADRGDGEIPSTGSASRPGAQAGSERSGHAESEMPDDRRDVSIGVKLRLLAPYALSRAGLPYQKSDESTQQHGDSDKRLSLRKNMDELKRQLGVGEDTIYRWTNLIRSKGVQNIVAEDLVVRRSDGGAGKSRLKHVEALLMEAIEQICVKENRDPKREKTIRMIHEYLLAKGVTKPPSDATIRKRAKSKEVAEARLDSYQRDFLCKVAGKPEDQPGPLSKVLVDGTQFTNEEYELRCIDDKGRDLGPVNVIWGIMAANRGIWTVLPVVGAANQFLAGVAIMRGLTDKTLLLEKYKISGVWPFHGKPGMLLHDYGKEYKNEHLKAALERRFIGFVQHSVPNVPHFRGTIERFNRTAHQLFHDFLESEFCQRRVVRLDADKKTGKVTLGITMPDLDCSLIQWVVKEYHHREHKGLGHDTPMGRWDKLISGKFGRPAAGIAPPVARTPELEWDFLLEHASVINHLGICLKDRHYVAAELKRFFKLGKRSSVERVSYRYHPYELKSVFVRWEKEVGEGYEYLEVPWSPEPDKQLLDKDDEHAAKNPTMWHWDALRRQARANCDLPPSPELLNELAKRKAARLTKTKGRGKATKKEIVENQKAETIRSSLDAQSALQAAAGKPSSADVNTTPPSAKVPGLVEKVDAVLPCEVCFTF